MRAFSASRRERLQGSSGDSSSEGISAYFLTNLDRREDLGFDPACRINAFKSSMGSSSISSSGFGAIVAPTATKSQRHRPPTRTESRFFKTHARPFEARWRPPSTKRTDPVANTDHRTEHLQETTRESLEEHFDVDPRPWRDALACQSWEVCSERLLQVDPSSCEPKSEFLQMKIQTGGG
jgi:hypothetical protein